MAGPYSNQVSARPGRQRFQWPSRRATCPSGIRREITNSEMSDALQSDKPATGRARMEPPDLSEKGGVRNGQPQRSDERLFMQLLAFGGCSDPRAVAAHLAASSVEHIV